MPHARASLPTRRGLLAMGGAIGIGAALTACGGGGKESGAAGGTKAGASGAWSFTDDRGQTAKTKARPENIVAFTGTAAALHDYGIEVKGVFGPTRTKDGKPDVQAGGLDIGKVEIIGNVYGEFSIEKYAALQPDVLITDMWQKDVLWYVPDNSKDKILKLAPSVALWAADESMPQALQRRADLAGSLGADLGAKRTTDAKAAFEKASARLRAATKANPGITVLLGSASPDLFYVSEAKRSCDTRYFQELGVRFVTPKVDSQGFFESLSWENVGKYPADLILMDNRTGTLQPADLGSKPTWAQLPAVKAQQVLPRLTEPIYSYERVAPIVDALAQAIEKAKKAA
ncbi:ABC transporter substrate-binding protein [Streptomyces sp. NBC_00083]|uniref:ABC transporter substrate-binding protein n=1 Tax=Streptomyces sp. NBC_00083 TaxID=2975647 RepID=UPI0022500853|nr:ABC transporter substrate-binding protein [Streptomyces sp. NBC_00083]MCX5382302.1 ABC transporter substrate-binding protein [Streptomyces sp. NBC_00083]